MTQPDELEEKASKNVMVSVECLGITTRVGFSLEPEGFPPKYQEFDPQQLVLMPKEYADFLVEQDKARFRISAPPKSAKEPEAKPSNAPAVKKAPAAPKTGRKTAGAKK